MVCELYTYVCLCIQKPEQGHGCFPLSFSALLTSERISHWTRAGFGWISLAGTCWGSVWLFPVQELQAQAACPALNAGSLACRSLFPWVLSLSDSTNWVHLGTLYTAISRIWFLSLSLVSSGFAHFVHVRILFLWLNNVPSTDSFIHHGTFRFSLPFTVCEK